MVRSVKRTWAIAALCTFLAVALAAWPLVTREDPDGNLIDRSAEMWAHELLMKKPVPLREFQTDGCSGGMSVTWRQLADDFPVLAEQTGAAPPWEACCVAHDQAYFFAGGATSAEESFAARRKSDLEFYQCVEATGPEAGHKAMANAMYIAVRAGGGPCTGLPWRWGYGLADCSALTGDNDVTD